MTKVAAKELTEGDVQFISLVNRGANREPFRIMKGVDGMIDLARVFKFGTAAKTGIAFVAVSKAIEQDAAKALVEKGGFSTENIVEQDAGTVFVQEGFSATDKVVLYRVTDDVMLGVAVPDAEKVMKGYESYNWQSTDFSEVLATEQTIPLFHLAMSALCDTFYNTLQKAETPDEARASVQKMLNDFSAHVLDVLGNVPVTAFKLETVLADILTVVKTDNQAPDEGAETKTDTEESEEADASDDETSEEDAGDAEAVQKTDEEDADATDETAADDADAEDDTDGEDPEAVEKGMGKGKGKTACKGTAKEKGKMKPGMDQSAAEEKPDASGKKMPAKKAEDEADASDDAPPAWATALLKSVEDVNAQVASVASEVSNVKKNVDELGKDLSDTKANFAKMDEALGTGVVGGDAEDEEEAGTKTATRKGDGSFVGDDEGFVNFDTAFGDPFGDDDK